MRYHLEKSSVIDLPVALEQSACVARSANYGDINEKFSRRLESLDLKNLDNNTTLVGGHCIRQKPDTRI